MVEAALRRRPGLPDCLRVTGVPLREEGVLSADRTEAATVFLLFLYSLSSSSSVRGRLGFARRSLNAILVVHGAVGVGGADPGGMDCERDACRSRRARVASALRSSCLQLSVWRSLGMRSLLSSCAATAQGTSGGGGVGGLDTDRGEPPFSDMPDTLRRSLGVVMIFATEDCVGEEYVGGMLLRGFLGSTDGGGVMSASIASSSEVAHQADS